MRLLERWLRELLPTQRILDLGCGAGSLPAQLAGMRVIGVDVDPKELARNPDLACVCAESHRIPFASGSFDFIVCHHSLEHIRDVLATIEEIRRVLSPEGRLFVSVPDGASASDRLYRLLFCGGGHWQRFSFKDVVSSIESGTGLRLAGSRELATSFNFVEKRNFIPAPYGRLPGPLPRRMRWLGRLPGWCFSGARLLLNLGTRLADRCFSTNLSRYGWALAFAPEAGDSETEPACSNVCMSCGATVEQAREGQVTRFFYRCPHCSTLNFLFTNRA
jgi:SAM-dependent methyltransferase/DNA-directed RNA polymerase subunit RPC12/RpoP